MTDIVTIILTMSGWAGFLWAMMWGMDMRNEARQAQDRPDIEIAKHEQRRTQALSQRDVLD